MNREEWLKLLGVIALAMGALYMLFVVVELVATKLGGTQ